MRVVNVLDEFPRHPADVDEERDDGEPAEPVDQQEVCDDVSYREYEDKARSLFVAEKLGICDVFGLVLGSFDLARYLPYQSREVQRECGKYSSEGEGAQTVLYTKYLSEFDNILPRHLYYNILQYLLD